MYEAMVHAFEEGVQAIKAFIPMKVNSRSKGHHSLDGCLVILAHGILRRGLAFLLHDRRDTKEEAFGLSHVSALVIARALRDCLAVREVPSL